MPLAERTAINPWPSWCLGGMVGRFEVGNFFYT